MSGEGKAQVRLLTGAQILARLNALGTSGLALADDVFAIKGSADATKLARFEVDGITTGTTRTFTLPDADVVVAGSAAALTSGRVPYVTAGGLLADAAGLTYNGTTQLTVGSGSGIATVVMDGGAGSERRFYFRTGGVDRWKILANSTAEAGSNAGSDLVVNARDDAGNSIDNPLSIARVAGGAITMVRPVTLSTASGGLTIAKATGTTLVVSSTAATCATFAGGAAFGNDVAVSRTTNGAVSLTATNLDTGASADARCTLTNDGSRTANFISYGSGQTGTIFGNVRANWVAMTAGGSPSGIAFGNVSNDNPIIFGTATGEVLRMSGTLAAGSLAVKYTGAAALTVAGGATFGGTVTLTTTGSQALHAIVSDTFTANQPDGITLAHRSSSTPAAGFGVALRMVAESTTTDDRSQFLIQSEWVVATDASRTSRAGLYVFDTAAREAIRLQASGTAAMVGFLGASAVVRQTIGAAATDPATTQTLANNMRTALINLGLCAA